MPALHKIDHKIYTKYATANSQTDVLLMLYSVNINFQPFFFIPFKTAAYIHSNIFVCLRLNFYFQ